MRGVDHVRAISGAVRVPAAVAGRRGAIVGVSSTATLLSWCLIAAALAAPGHAGVTWARPVAGEPIRPFAMRGSPFTAGQHRGVDLAARPGTTVGAPCAGRIAVARRIGSSGGVVTVACGPWRASVLPLAQIGVHRGAHVTAGAPVGTADASTRHAGVHVGVRRAGERFGYVDPLRLLPRGEHLPPVPVGPGARGRLPEDPARPSTHTRLPEEPVGPPARTRPIEASTPAVAARIRPSAAPPAANPASPHAALPLAPWPAWIGMALLLAAAAGGLRGRWARTHLRAARPRTGRMRMRDDPLP